MGLTPSQIPCVLILSYCTRVKLPNKTTERKFFKSGYGHIIAIDEVGMGCLAGPVVVCAVLVDKKFISQNHRTLLGLKESKLLNKKQREYFSGELKRLGIKYQIGFSYPKTIDRLNIHNATQRAMRKTVLKLGKGWRSSGTPKRAGHPSIWGRTPTGPRRRIMILIDGNKKINNLDFEQQAIVKGDRKVLSIACASIIAKVFRDNMMERYAKKYPGYGLEKHMGYGTRYHFAQLLRLGPSAIHRKSFEPVAKLL